MDDLNSICKNIVLAIIMILILGLDIYHEILENRGQHTDYYMAAILLSGIISAGLSSIMTTFKIQCISLISSVFIHFIVMIRFLNYEYGHKANSPILILFLILSLFGVHYFIYLKCKKKKKIEDELFSEDNDSLKK